MRVLLISDDWSLKESLMEALRDAGHDFALTEDPSVPWRLARRDLDMVFYDLRQGKEAQWEGLADWRHKVTLPIIVLGPAGDEPSAVRALAMGVDSYIKRPLWPAELVARVEALQRRSLISAGKRYVPPKPRGHVELDEEKHYVQVGNRSVALSPTEFRILSLLVKYQGHTVPQEEIIRRVWRSGEAPDSQRVRLYVQHLRRKIERDPKHPSIVCTQYGLGYSISEAGIVEVDLAGAAEGE